MARDYQTLDKEITEWLLSNLRAGRAAVFRRSKGNVRCRAWSGEESPFSSSTEALVERVSGTGRAEVLSEAVCVPLHGIHREVVGALLLDLPFEGEDFNELDLRFCQRCARWSEVARMGRATPPKPRLSGDKAPTENDLSSTVEVRLYRAPAEGKSSSSLRLTRPAVFFRSLHTLLSAGLPINESLHFLAESGDTNEDKALLTELADSLTDGWKLSLAMSRFSGAFGPYITGLVGVGEQTGSLDRVLDVLARYLEESDRLTRKIKASLVYPSILATGALLFLFLAPPYVLAGHLEMLRESKQELPFLTSVMLLWSDLCRAPGTYIVLVVGLLSLMVFTYNRRTKVMDALYNFRPARHLLQLLGTTRFARALAMSLRAGQTATVAIPYSARATGDARLIESCEEATRRLVGGEGIGESLAAADYFPRSFCEVVSVAEEIAAVDSMLDMMADILELEIDSAIKTLSSIAEPLILLLVGIVTAVVLVAVLQPTVLVLQSL